MAKNTTWTEKRNTQKNDEDGNNKDSNHISEEKQELSDSSTVEDWKNAKHELTDNNTVQDSQNAKQELNDSNIVEDSQNAEQKLNDRNTAEDIKTTEKIRDEEESCKKDINGKMEYTTVKNNKDTCGILKFEKQEATSDGKSIFWRTKNREECSHIKKAHKESMEDKVLEEELGKNQESNTEICGKEIKI